MILGIGTDLVETDRIAKTIERHGDKFLQRCFTASEIAYCMGHATPQLPFAARFAAKEAIAKAFGLGIGLIGWTELEICKLESGQPVVTLHGAAQERAQSLNVTEVKISMTHTHNYAAAYALILCEPVQSPTHS